MKRISLLLALSFVLLSFGLANAIGFEAHVEPGNSFVDGINTYYYGNTDLYIAIGMQNTEAIYHTGFKVGLLFTTTNGATMTHVVPGGGSTQVSSITLHNGWNDNPADLTRYWKSLHVLAAPDWDGTLPDNFSNDVLGEFSSTGGWDATDITMQDRYRIHINVPTPGPNPATDVRTICVDENTPDWLFPDPQDFGGPYCFNFLTAPNFGPTVNGTPLSLTTPHHVAFDKTYAITDAEGDPITGVGAVDEDNNPLGTATLGGTPGARTIHWVFDPPCSWVTDGISHVVKLYAEDGTHAYPAVTLAIIDLDVTNSAPVIAGDCGDVIVAGVDQIKHAYFTATDANGGADSKTWAAVPVPVPNGAFGIVDGDLSFTPTTLDDGLNVVFTVSVTDCAGAVDDCTVTFQVISQMPFFVEIEAEDGSITKAPGDGVYLGHHAYVDVTQLQGSEHNLGFDLLIAYDNSALAFMGAYGNPVLFNIPGVYEWEYFTYRFVDNCGGSCPSGLLQVVAIADQNDGAHHPDLTILPVDFVLFTMDFMVTNDYTLECSFVPISFFWRDCTDNSIAMNFRSDPALVVLQAISRYVFGYNGGYFDITDPTFGWPTFYGAQEECLSLDPDKPNIQFVDFFNGGIKIICSDDIDARGDINLNGVDNEIADAVVFTNYFIYGLSAFTINVEGQKAATDVNADGIPLSVADLVYLIRVVVGDIMPIPKLTPNLVNANFGHDGQLVTVDVALGAALFVFEGNVDVQLAQDAAHMEIKSGVVDGNTNVLIYSFERGATFSGNILNTQGTLISVESADYNGSAYKTIMVPSSFSVKSYPNPFNAAASIEMALPVASNWNLAIYNVAGQKVAEFAGYAEAGINTVIWDASASASGIYFYKVTTNEGSMTKKMVLLK